MMTFLQRMADGQALIQRDGLHWLGETQVSEALVVSAMVKNYIEMLDEDAATVEYRLRWQGRSALYEYEWRLLQVDSAKRERKRALAMWRKRVYRVIRGVP